MRKLLLAVLIVASLAVWAIAADVNIGVSGKAKFSLTFSGGPGGSIGSTFTDGPDWSFTADTGDLSVSISGTLTTNPVLSINSISGENDKFGFTFGSFDPSGDGLGWSSYVFSGLSDTGLLLNFKEFSLDLAVVDVGDATKTFDDAVVGHLVLSGLGEVAFDYAADVQGFGAEANITAISDLDVKLGFGKDATTTAYAVYAKYTLPSFDLGVAGLDVSAALTYTSGLATLSYASGSDSQEVAVDASAYMHTGVDAFEGATVTTTFTYGFDGSMSLPLTVDVAGGVDPVSYSVNAEWADLLTSTTQATVTLDVGATLPLGIEVLSDPSVSFTYHYYMKDGSYDWSLSVTSALYGLLDTAFSMDDTMSWSVTLSKEIEF